MVWSLLIVHGLFVAASGAWSDLDGGKCIEPLSDEQKPAELSPQRRRSADESADACSLGLGAIATGDYEASRDLTRRAVSNLAIIRMISQNPQLRVGAYRVAPLCGSLLPSLSPRPPVEQKLPALIEIPEAPPIEMRVPAPQNVPDSDRQSALELQSRYEVAASQAGTAWQSAEVIRKRLMARGMELNIQTATSLSRMQAYLNSAMGFLRAGAWEDARDYIARAEYETRKVMAVVGH